MTDQQWQCAWEIYQAASELPDAERPVFLASVSVDPEVFQEVLLLLDEPDPQPSSDPELKPGAKIGRYEIMGTLGRGGMGRVYSAFDPELGRLVALKFLSPEAVATPRATDRLLREAKAASTLNHPHIVTVYEVVHRASEVAIAMELVEGEALRNRCGKPQPVAQVIRWGRQVAQALAATHERKIIHRDVKPENLMLRTDGYIKVLDFGLARQLTWEGQNPPTSASGRLAGTLNYMAPEQIRAEAATSASDVFSLGVVLYELVTGTHPFRSDSPLDAAHAIAHAEPKPPRVLNGDVPPALNSLLLAMLAKDPCARPSAAEVERKLAEIEAAPSPTTAWSPLSRKRERAELVSPEKSRRPAKSAGLRQPILVAGLAACLTFALALWFMRPRVPGPREPEMTQLTRQASENRVTAAAISPSGKYLAFAELGGPIDLQRISDGFTQPLSTPPGLSVSRIAWFADGSRLLVSGSLGYDRGGIWAVPIRAGKAKLVISNGKDATPSPDGTRIAFTSLDDSAIWVTDVDGDNARVIRDGGSSTAFSSLIWSPDSKRVAYERTDYGSQTNRPADQFSPQLQANYSYSYESADVGTGQVAASAKDVVITSACGLPDGRVLFLRWISLPRTLADQLWELRTDPHTGKLRGPPRQLTYRTYLILSSVSASNDGKQVVAVTTSYRPSVYIADLSPAGQIPRLLNIRRLTFKEAGDFPHAWTRDNRTIIFESDRTGHYCLYRQNIREAEAEPLVVSAGDKVLPQVSPDGKWVLYESMRGTGNWTLMRVPIGGGKPERVPVRGKLNKFDEFRCPLDAGAPCVLRTVENGQFVFNGLDTIRGEGRELARTDWSPAIIGDWALSPDGSEVAIPNHSPDDAKIRLIALKHRAPGRAEKTIMLRGLKNLNGVVWAAQGQGLYVSVRTGLGGLMVYANLQGRWSKMFESSQATYMVPSHGGRHVAFPRFVAWSNAWLFHGF